MSEEETIEASYAMPIELRHWGDEEWHPNRVAGFIYPTAGHYFPARIKMFGDGAWTMDVEERGEGNWSGDCDLRCAITKKPLRMPSRIKAMQTPASYEEKDRPW